MPLALVVLSTGLSTALAMPFLSLFLETAVHAGPVRTPLILVSAPIAGVTASWAIGRVSDRWPIRRHLLVATAVAGLVGMGVTAFVRNYWVLFAVTVTATAVAMALFPQAFAFARQLLDRPDADGGPNRAALGISALRTVYSVSWVAGPPLAAVLLATGGFRLVYGGAAVMYGVAAVVAYFGLPDVEAAAPPPAEQSTVDTGPRISPSLLVLTIVGFTLLQTPLTLGVQALPLFIADDLGRAASNAGLILGLCAALEIPLMLGLGALSTRIPVRTLILVGGAAGIVYQTLAATAQSVWVLAAAQVVNAMFIAAVAALGIPYMQDLMPGRPGRATTMYTNTFPLGNILTGPLFGIAQENGYRLAYVMNLGLCAAGLLLLAVARPARTPTEHGPLPPG